MGNGGDYTNAALYLAQLQQQQQGGNSSNGGNPVSGRPSGSEQFYQPIYQQLYQNNNVDTPYGASQYGKGVQYLQNPFSYAPPGVSYGSQGGMGGMSNPFTYRGGNISANSGMGYGGYGAYGTQTPGSQTGTPPPQTGGVNQYIYGPGGMFPGGNGTPTGAVTTPPRSTASSAGTSNDALLAAIQAYIANNPTATRTSVPTGAPTGGFTAGPVTPKGPVVGPTGGTPTGGFVTGPGPSGGGFSTGPGPNTPAASNYTPSAADNKAYITWMLAQPNPNGAGTLADVYKAQGITDPFSDPLVVARANDQNVRANNRINLINSAGATPPPGANIAPWQDPNWEKYQGTNKEAYTTAQRVMTDPAYARQFSSETGLTGDNLQSWLLRSTDPAAWNKQAAIDSANAGLVTGPSPNSSPASTPESDMPDTPTRSSVLSVLPSLDNPFTDTGTAPVDYATAPAASDNYSDNGYDTGGGKRGGKVSKDGIAALLRRR